MLHNFGLSSFGGHCQMFIFRLASTRSRCSWHTRMFSCSSESITQFSSVSFPTIFKHFHNNSFYQSWFAQHRFQGWRDHRVFQKSKRSWSNCPGEKLFLFWPAHIIESKKSENWRNLQNKDSFSSSLSLRILQSGSPSPIEKTSLKPTYEWGYPQHWTNLCPVSWSILRFFLRRLKAATTCMNGKRFWKQKSLQIL